MLPCTSVHIINSVRGPAAVKSTLEHYQPILNTLNFQQPKGKKLNKVRAITPGAPSHSSDLQGSCADLPDHSRNCLHGPHSHSCWDKCYRLMSIWLHINLSVLKMISRTNKGRKIIFVGHVINCGHPRRQRESAGNCHHKSYDQSLCCAHKD